MTAPWLIAMAALTGMVFSTTPALVSALEHVQLPTFAHASTDATAGAKAPSAGAFHRRDASSFSVANRNAGIAGVVTASGLRVRTAPSAPAISIRTSSLGRTGRTSALAATAPVSATDLTATIRRGHAIEWFQNKKSVLQQGWTIAKRPAGQGKLHLGLAIDGARVRVASPTGLLLTPATGRALTYDHLVVRDARGVRLPAHFTRAGTGARIVVDDAGAAYPVVIDPDIASIQTLATPPSANGNSLGSDVAVSGTWMAVKEPGAHVDPTSTTKPGRIDVYHDSTGNGSWQLVSQLYGAADGSANINTTGVAIVVEPAGVTVFGVVATNVVRVWTFAGDPETVAPSASPVEQPTITPVQPSGAFLATASTLAADGNLLVIGFPLAGDQGVRDQNQNAPSENIGSAEIFRRTGAFGTGYTLDSRIDPPGGITQPAADRDIAQLFGTSVAVNAAAGLVVVGAPGDDGVQTHTGGPIGAGVAYGVSTYQGAADVFRNTGGSTWAQVGRIAATTQVPDARFGSSVGLAPNGSIVVGAPNETVSGLTNVGAGYVFDKASGSDSWSQVQRSVPDDPTTAGTNEAAASSAMGTKAAIDPSSNHVYFSAPNQAIGTGLNGAIYAYTRAGGVGTASFSARMVPQTASDQHGGLAQGFGNALAATNSLVVAGASGFGNANETLAGRVITFNRSGTSYSLVNEISPTTATFGDYFGNAVAQDGDILAVAMPHAVRGSGFGTGAVAVYHRDNTGTWVFEQMLFPNSAIQTNDPGTWAGTIAVHVTRDSGGNDIGLTVAVGDWQDSRFDADGNNPGAPVTISNAGSVAVFGRNGGPGTTYSNGFKIWAGGTTNSTPLSDLSEVQANAQFGRTIAFTADGTLLVGAPFADAGAGAVYRFDKATPTTSVLNYLSKEKITPAAGTAKFGDALAADGTSVLVAPGDGSGLARYTDGNPSTNLAATGTFPMSFQDTFAGFEPIGLSLVGNRFAVSGDDPNDGDPFYRVRVYRIVNNIAVRETDFRTTNGLVGLGLSLNHGGSVPTLVVGSPIVGGPGGDTSVMVAKVKGDGSAQWSKSGNLTIPNPAGDSQFGYSVTNWPNNGGAAVGAPQLDLTGINSGAVFTYPTAGVVPPAGPQAFVDVSLPSSVQVGATQVKTAGLSPSLLTNKAATAGTVASTAIGSLDLSVASPGSTTAAAPLASIPLRSIPLRSIPLRSIPLSAIPLRSIGGWEAVLAGTPYAGLPLQDILLSDVYALPSVQDLTLGALDLAGSPLRSIPLASIALGATPLRSIDINPDGTGDPVAEWCAALSAVHADTAALGLDCDHPSAASNDDVTVLSIGLKGAPLDALPLRSIPLRSIDLATLPLRSIPLRSIGIANTPLRSIPLRSIPLRSIDLGAITLAGTPLRSIPLSSIDIGATPLRSIPLRSIDLSAVPLRSIPLRSIPLRSIPLRSIDLGATSVAGTPLRSIPLRSIDIGSTPLRSIPLRSIDTAQLDTLVDCSVFACDTPNATLADAAAAGAVRGTLGDLGALLAGLRLSDLIGAGDQLTADQLRNALADGTLGDLTTYDDLQLGDLNAIWPYLTLGQIQSLATGVRLSDLANNLLEYKADAVTAALADTVLSLADVSDWDTVTLSEVTPLIEQLSLGDLGPALSGIRLGDLADAISNDNGGRYSDADLRQALEATLGADAALGALGDLDDVTLGELGQYGDATMGDLLSALSAQAQGTLTLADLLLALISPKQYPWEKLDLSQVSAQALDDTPTGSPVQVAYRGDAPDGLPRTVTLTVQLPHGSRLDPTSVTGDGTAAEKVPVLDGSSATWTFEDVPANAVRELGFTLQAPLTIGPAQVRATAFLPADDETATDTAGTVVSEAYEPNDTVAQATPLADDTITLSHISQTGDLDVYKFDVTQPGTRVSVSLSNLDADLDLVLYGPRDGTVVATSNRSLDPVTDQGDSGLPAAQQQGSVTTQSTTGNDQATPSDLGSLATVQGSFNRGRGDEQIDTGVLTRTGTYYLAVTGYNAAVDTQPYALRLKRFVSHDAPSCPARSVTPGAVGSALPASLPAGTNTVFVANRSRMSGLFGADRTNALMDRLDSFVTWVNGQSAVGVKAAVLNVDADAAVRDAYAQWDASPCQPAGANAAVSEIARILNGYRSQGSALTNVVLVGGDDAVPFARVPDNTKVANETGYASTFSDAGNALYATFASGSLQTDNAYVDRDPYAFGNTSLYVPDAAVARLVESPSEITDQLDDFQNAGGLLAAQTGLVTGYDFLSDGAQAVKSKVASTYPTVDSHLISDTWTRQDLEDAIGTIKPDLLSINAHFDHYRSLPGDGNANHDESDLFTAAAVRGALAGDLAGSVVFSMGCHSGLSASDSLLTDERALDFAQAISSQGGVFVGNTGFGYGDTETVALSEELMKQYAQRLNGSMSVGEALMYAKNAYFSGLAEFTPYDQKVLEETTFYGLPFYRLDVANPPPVVAPSSPVLTPDQATGLDVATTHLAPTYLNRTAGNGTTYVAAQDPVTGDDSLTTVQNRPVEPKVDTEYGLPAGRESHDALVLGLTSVDTPDTDPYVFQPTVNDGKESAQVGVDTAFPTKAVQVNPGTSPAGETFHVAATTGYFRTTAADGTGLQRTYKSMDVQTYLTPAGSDDFVAPTFSQVTGEVHDGVISISTHVTDDRGLPSRVKRVRVLLLQDPRAGVTTTWRGLDLVRTGGTDEWTGSLPSTGRNLELVLQAVDAAGNVGVTTDKADNFADGAVTGATVDDGTGTGGGTIGDLNVDLNGPLGGDGWYTGPVTVTVTGGTKLVYEVVGEGDPTGYQEPFQVTGTGLHTVRVTSGDGQVQTVTVSIDTVGPKAQVDSPAVGQTMPAAPGALISYSCPDAGSGPTTCTGYLDGTAVASGTTVPLPPGSHTVTVSAGPDRAGNPASLATTSRTFTVLGAPATVGAIGVSKAKDGSPTTLSVPFTGYAVLTYSGTVAWGDGSTTNCAMAGSGCTVTRNTAGGGILTVTHTYASAAVDTTATVTVVDNLGQTASATVKVNRKTTLSATAALLQLRATTNVVELKSGSISATLKDGSGAAVAGQSIKFTLASGTVICTATTNTSGVAACPTTITYTLEMLLAGRYYATFAGKDVYRGSSASASLIG